MSAPAAFADASRALPEFPEIDLQGKSLPEGVELEHIKSFQLLYREHCEVNPTLPAAAPAGRCVSAQHSVEFVNSNNIVIIQKRKTGGNKLCSAHRPF